MEILNNETLEAIHEAFSQDTIALKYKGSPVMSIVEYDDGLLGYRNYYNITYLNTYTMTIKSVSSKDGIKDIDLRIFEETDIKGFKVD